MPTEANILANTCSLNFRHYSSAIHHCIDDSHHFYACCLWIKSLFRSDWRSLISIPIFLLTLQTSRWTRRHLLSSMPLRGCDELYRCHHDVSSSIVILLRNGNNISNYLLWITVQSKNSNKFILNFEFPERRCNSQLT